MLKSDVALGLSVLAVALGLYSNKPVKPTLTLTRPTAAYTLLPNKSPGQELATILHGRELKIYCANCGPLADQLADAIDGAGGKENLIDIPFANPGLWVSPVGPDGDAIAKVLENATGKHVNVDTLPDVKSPGGASDGGLSSHDLAIVVSKMPRIHR